MIYVQKTVIVLSYSLHVIDLCLSCVSKLFGGVSSLKVALFSTIYCFMKVLLFVEWQMIGFCLSQYFSNNKLLNLQYQNGQRVKKYRGMGSLEAMTKGSDQRYLGDTTKLKIAQGVVGAVADKGSVLKFVPYTMQAVKQGFQDLGASSLKSAHDLLRGGVLRLEVWFIIVFYFFSLWL